MATFKSYSGDGRVLGISKSYSEISVCLTVSGDNGLGDCMGIYIDKKDIPKVIGELLSKSGVRSVAHGSHRAGSHAHLEFILSHVENYNEAVKRAEEDAEQKKLEDEALVLLNAIRSFHGKPLKAWEDTHVEVQEEFLVLAKAARTNVEEDVK